MEARQCRIGSPPGGVAAWVLYMMMMLLPLSLYFVIVIKIHFLGQVFLRDHCNCLSFAIRFRHQCLPVLPSSFRRITTVSDRRVCPMAPSALQHDLPSPAVVWPGTIADFCE